MKAYLHWELPSLPISKGQQVGEVRLIELRGEMLKAVPLLAEYAVEPTWIFSLKEKWRLLF